MVLRGYYPKTINNMKDINVITIGGNLTRDAELKYTKSGKPVLNFSIANSTGFGDREQTNFFDCCMFGERTEKLAPHLKKGKSVTAVGEHTQSIWTDAETGKERRRFELRISELTFQRQSRSEDHGGSTNYDRAQAQVQQPTQSQEVQSSQPQGDDIPF